MNVNEANAKLVEMGLAEVKNPIGRAIADGNAYIERVGNIDNFLVEFGNVTITGSWADNEEAHEVEVDWIGDIEEA